MASNRPARQPEPVELSAYALGRQLASKQSRRTQIQRREVHLPTGEVLVEEFIVIEEDI